MSPVAFFGRITTWLCLFTGGRFLSAFPFPFHPSSSQSVAGARAFQQYGHWEILQSNDPLVDSLAPPRIVQITPGKFRIGALVFGSFEFVHEDDGSTPAASGVHVQMSLYNLRMLRRVYRVVPTGTDRMAFFGADHDNHDIMYLLQRVKGKGGVENENDADGSAT